MVGYAQTTHRDRTSGSKEQGHDMSDCTRCGIRSSYTPYCLASVRFMAMVMVDHNCSRKMKAGINENTQVPAAECLIIGLEMLVPEVPLGHGPQSHRMHPHRRPTCQQLPFLGPFVAFLRQLTCARGSPLARTHFCMLINILEYLSLPAVQYVARSTLDTASLSRCL